MININGIIEWCNTNSGFVQSVLALLTLFISVVAVFVSITATKIPYKKRFLVTCGSYFGFDYDDEGVHVTCVNCGNRPVHIRKLGFFIKPGSVILNINTLSESQKKLDPGDETCQYFSSKYLKNQLSKFDGSKKIYAYVEDFEGTKRKKCLGLIGKFLQ